MNSTSAVKEWTFYAAGVQHHGLHTVIDSMSDGEELVMEEEPKNPYDPFAVKLKYNGVQVGYVPKKYSKEVTYALSHFGECVAHIDKVDPDAKSWSMLKVTVTVL